MGFSHKTGLPHLSASKTSARWQELGVVTNTQSTSGDRHRVSDESNANGISKCRADSRALSKVRRERAVTRQFRASANPGVSRLAACNPKPRIPKRIICVQARSV